MKLRKLIIAVYLLSIIICFFATRWYYTVKYKKEAIKRGNTNVQYYDFLLDSLSLNNKKQLQKGLKVLKDHQVRLLAKDLGIPYDGNPLSVMQKVDKNNYQTITKPLNLKLSPSVIIIQKKNAD